MFDQLSIFERNLISFDDLYLYHGYAADKVIVLDLLRGIVATMTSVCKSEMRFCGVFSLLSSRNRSVDKSGRLSKWDIFATSSRRFSTVRIVE